MTRYFTLHIQRC